MKLQEYQFSRNIRKDIAFLDFVSDIKTIINYGRYQQSISSTIPTYTGDDGETVLYISGNIKRFYFFDLSNTTWNYLTPMVSTVSLTGQTATISATALFTPQAVSTYRISVYHICTKAGTGGTLATTIGWTDNGQAQTTKPAGDINLTAKGNAASGMSFLQSVSSVAITYTATVSGASGAPEYDLYMTLEQMS